MENNGQDGIKILSNALSDSGELPIDGKINALFDEFFIYINDNDEYSLIEKINELTYRMLYFSYDTELNLFIDSLKSYLIDCINEFPEYGLPIEKETKILDFLNEN